MDVDKVSFQARLLDILLAVGEASFVSFDLELSGVPVRQPGEAAGKPSLQDRYLETKEAAEKFQILQIGITCVKEEADRGVYLCRPFNFNLSPIIEERKLDIDRTFSFHSGAVDFLLGVGFQIDLPFTSGVPYLSRSEAELAIKLAESRNDRSVVADIQVKPGDTQSLAFLRRVRNEIDNWIKQDLPYLLITPRKEHGQPVETELSRFERRLVHQLVRAEYPALVTVPSRGMIRIMRFDHEREARIKAERMKEARERIDRQTGFRWVVEAMAGNPPSHMDARQFAVSPETGEPVLANLDSLRSKYSQALHLLFNKKTVLVGHNMFLDLIYLYHTFIGSLPNDVDAFVALIHDIFPLIVDTKYMATHNCGDINPRSSLEEIAEQLSLQQYPLLETHKDHRKYRGTTAFHEAGYDSLLTAQVAVRLSAKLGAAGLYIDDSSEHEDVGGVKLDEPTAESSSEHQEANTNMPSTSSSSFDKLKDFISAPIKALTLGDTSENDPQGSVAAQSPTPPTTIGAEASAVPATASKKKKKRPRQKNEEEEEKGTADHVAGPGRFAHATVFDQLQDTAVEESEDEDVILQFDDLPTTATASAPVAADTDGVSRHRVAPEDWDTPYWKRESGRAMPGFDSDFWATYGNKLRVFGTEEGVCLLDQ